MASLSVLIDPFVVPDTVVARLPGGGMVEVALEELEEETLAILIDEFSQAILTKVAK